LDQVDGARGVPLGIGKMSANLEDVEVALQMRKLRIAMQCQYNELFRLLNPKLKQGNDS